MNAWTEGGRERAVLLELLRAGLWQRAPRDLALFPLPAEAWQRLRMLARQQTVTGLVYEGLCRLPEALLPPDALLVQWVADVEVIERAAHRMDRVLDELCRELLALGLHPVLLKGQGVAQFYPHPYLRPCGDIDLYFPHPAERERALEWMLRQGIAVSKAGDGSGCFRWHGVEVEVHPRLFDLSSPFSLRHLRRWEAAEGFRPWRNLEVPAPALNLLLLGTHIMKHAFGWGIGLRQLCDLARACYVLHPEVDAADFRRRSAALGLDRWNRLLHAFLVEVLDLPPACLPYPERADSAEPLLAVVWRGGNFGFLHRQKRGGSRWNRKLHTLRSLLVSFRFSGQYAPAEAVWMVLRLAHGQWKN